MVVQPATCVPDTAICRIHISSPDLCQVYLKLILPSTLVSFSSLPSTGSNAPELSL